MKGCIFMENKGTKILKIYSEKELAEALEVSQWTVRLWRLQSGLPYFRTAGRIFYRMETVIDWIDKQERKNSDQVISII